MMERAFNIPLHDGKVAYSKIQGDFNQPVIIFVHGLTSSMERILPYSAMQFFAQNGYSFLRFNLYDWRKDARDLWDCTLGVHARDLDTIVDYCFDQGAGTVHVIGHSYGGLTIFMSKQQAFTSAIMYDPSHAMVPPFGDRRDIRYVKEIDGYLDKSGIDFAYSKAFVEESRNLNPDDYLKDYNVPTIIFNAERGVLAKAGEDYHKRLGGKTRVERYLIENADHSFTDNN